MRDKAKMIQAKHRRLLGNLKLLQRIYTAQALIAACGIPKATFYYKMQEPWRRFNFDEFMMIADYCNIEVSDLIEREIKITSIEVK